MTTGFTRHQSNTNSAKNLHHSPKQKGNEMNHTPGPWEREETYDTISLPIRAEGKVIALVVHADERLPQLTPEELKANARLIAAAPDLLDCCQRLMPLLNNCKGYVDVVDEAIDLMRSAINKATQGNTQ